MVLRMYKREQNEQWPPVRCACCEASGISRRCCARCRIRICLGALRRAWARSSLANGCHQGCLVARNCLFQPGFRAMGSLDINLMAIVSWSGP